MPFRSILFLALLLTPFAPCAAQSDSKTPAPEPAAPAEADPSAERRATLLADLHALEAESKELLKPIDAASAKAELAAAAWTLDRAWAEALLREALVLTFPAEVDRARLRDRPIGAPLVFGPAEDRARGRVRRRVYEIARRDREFARELGETEAREMGKVEEVSTLTAMASAAAEEGRLEEAGELILRAAESEPTLVSVGDTINQVALHDRALADRLALSYIERLRRLPLGVFTERNQTALRLPLSFALLLRPDNYPFPDGKTAPAAGREVVRAYVSFIVDTMTRIEQSGGDLTQMNVFITTVWPNMMQYAPEYAGQLAALERASRRQGQAAPPLRTFNELKTAYDPDRRYEERVKTARQTKDPLQLEVAASAAMSRNEFEEARKLIALMQDGDTKTRLAEEVNTKESLYLLGKGDLAGAERLARQLNSVADITHAFPPLVRRLAKDGDAGRAALLADEAGRLLRAAAEKSNSNDSFIPTALAPLAGAVRIYKQSRALEGMSEVALAVEPIAPQSALDLIDALVETAAKARVTSELGNPNFNPEAFARLSARDAGRVRSAAARLEDRLQRIAALAAVARAEAERLEKEGKKKKATP
ncbi:MAG: hypothetical protein JOZ96_02440 [Acidobacteria bacterium]|nr:hypothetical protein [Acidobacteriota bacterium]